MIEQFSQKAKVRILLVDDHPIVIEGLKSSLKNFDWIEIVDVATTGSDALVKANLSKPEIVLLDISLPDTTGVKVAEALRIECQDSAIIAYTMYNDLEYLKLLVKAGIRGFLLKESSLEELVGAIDVVAKGGTYFSPKVTGNLIVGMFNANNKKDANESEVNPSVLTSREREILILIAQGDKNRIIAEKLGLNPRTVEAHRRNMMMKLGIHSAAGLTRFALENGLVA